MLINIEKYLKSLKFIFYMNEILFEIFLNFLFIIGIR